MKAYEAKAVQRLIDNHTDVSKIFGPAKTTIRKEIEDGALKITEGLSDEQFVRIEALQRTYNEVRHNDKYEKYRDEYDSYVSDAT